MLMLMLILKHILKKVKIKKFKINKLIIRNNQNKKKKINKINISIKKALI
jgi:hypothetical protein